MNITIAINGLNSIWNNLGKKIITLPTSQKLWHSGIIDFNSNSLNQSVVTWFTPDSEQQDRYNQWAKDAEKDGYGVAYKNELSTQETLNLAQFGKVHFHEITANYLDYSHSNLNKALFEFCVQNNIDGIIRGETGNEVALRSDRVKTLKLIQQIKLS